MRERKCYVLREQFSEAGDKTQKARAFQARAAMGKVILPADAPWLDELLAELMAFPIGSNDDQVDFLSLIGRMLDAMLAPNEGQRKDGSKKTGWAKAFADQDRGSSSNWKIG
jgi:phage terminase large subunit-like protein